jgi:hypothetical protein
MIAVLSNEFSPRLFVKIRTEEPFQVPGAYLHFGCTLVRSKAQYVPLQVSKIQPLIVNQMKAALQGSIP